MIPYILKITVCLTILIAFYKLFLEHENMHVFKRFYLIASLLLSIGIPLIVFTEYVYIEPQPLIETYTPDFALEELHTTTTDVNLNYLNTILWSLYGLGVLAFGFKFCQNLLKINFRIRKNPKIKNRNSVNVLLNEKIAPHTFFNFIFLNKHKFEAHEIPNEVLLHEQTHANQKHSIDVLLIELLQVIFWFNPLVYIFKKAIKLNHEFLADQSVLQKGVETSAYQKIVLAFSSSAEIQETALTNAINYSSIKKRFTVMKKHTSKRAIWLRSLLVLPIFALVLYSFSETEIIEIEQAPEKTASFITDFEDILQQGKQSLNHKYNTKPNAPTSQDLAKWKNASEFAIWVNGKPIKNKDLNNYSEADFFHYFSSYVYNNARSDSFPQPYQINIYSKNVFEKQFITNEKEIAILINKDGQLMVQNKVLNSTELKEYLSTLNTDLSKEERSKNIRALIYTVHESPKMVIENVNSILEDYGCATINIVGPTFNQDGATKAQISEYNVLAKKYNTMNPNKMRIKKQEADRMEYLYNIMTTQQKSNAETYPEIHPMPEPPMAPVAPNSKLLEQEESLIKLDTKLALQERELLIKENKLSEQESKLEKLPFPPPPPAPKSPLDYVIEMAKKDATFYYEGEKISSDKAIALLKSNKNLNIDSRGSNNNKPVVRISKEAITIEN